MRDTQVRPGGIPSVRWYRIRPEFPDPTADLAPASGATETHDFGIYWKNALDHAQTFDIPQGRMVSMVDFFFPYRWLVRFGDITINVYAVDAAGADMFSIATKTYQSSLDHNNNIKSYIEEGGGRLLDEDESMSAVSGIRMELLAERSAASNSVNEIEWTPDVTLHFYINGTATSEEL